VFARVVSDIRGSDFSDWKSARGNAGFAFDFYQCGGIGRGYLDPSAR
jgi:hypothetical protein